MTDLSLSRLLELAEQLRKDGSLIEQGLAEAQAVPRLPRNADDGLPDHGLPHGSGYSDVREADPRKDKQAWEERIAQACAAIAGALTYQSYKRLALPRTHKDRQPTKDERLMAEGEGLDDDDVCQSCIRIGAVNPRNGGSKLCGWCGTVVRTYKDQWPLMEMPPVGAVRAHVEAQNGRTKVTTEWLEGQLKATYGTPKKVSAEVSPK